jgi:1,6-anhydro-N-acetylmuramate kinase
MEISGGGCQNNYLVRRLAQNLRNISVTKSNDTVLQNFREAVGFAVLGYRRVHHLTSDLTTGSKMPIILGELFKPNLS